jgi:hypothetical protein
MITVARVGVIDQTAPHAIMFESSPVALITSAAAIASTSTSPVKMPAF